MVTVKGTLTYKYLPTAVDPVGFEGTFAVYDTTAGGGAGETFSTVLTIDPGNATYWSLEADHATGLSDGAGGYTRHPAHVYDPNGISATWTERISDNASAPVRYVLRGKFGSPGGLIQIQAECTQMSDPTNSASLDPTNATSLALPIPATTAL